MKQYYQQIHTQETVQILSSPVTNSKATVTTGLVATQSVTSVEYTSVITNTKNYNFTGNYVWVRAYVSNWTDGTVNSIRLNH